jgi:hypothetical protein
MTSGQALLALAVCLTASATAAQEPPPIVTTAPASSARWDVSGHITWLGERRPADAIAQWDRWFAVASGGASAGYYWTPHLKTELDISTSNEGEDYTFVTVTIPGQTSPLFVERDHETRFTTASAGLTGQFFENAWFHPFVTAGLELVREREHIETIPPPVPPRGPTLTPTPLSETRVRYRGRAYTSVGFKVYVSEHTFLRSDLRTSWSADGLASLGWRSGVGVDF